MDLARHPSFRKNSRQTRLCVVLCLVLAGIAGAAGHASAQDAITMTVVPGAGGIVREGAAAPITVIASNSGPAVEAVVTVRWKSDVAGEEPEIFFRRLNLPQNSTKRVTLYAQPGPWTSEVVVLLRQGADANAAQRGRVLAAFSERLKNLEPEKPTLGIIGPPISGLPNPLDRQEEPLIQHLFFSADFLPGHHLGWEMCDAIVYTPDPKRSPSRAELDALREWVIRGGDLILNASDLSPVFANPVMLEMTPYVPSGQRQSFLEPFGKDMIHTVGRREAGSNVLLLSRNTPLVMQRKYGLGSVTAFAFDMSDPVFAKALLTKALWRRAVPDLFFVPGEDMISFEMQRYDNFTTRITQAVTRTPDVRVQLLVVVIMIGLYAVAIGPGDYLLAKRYKRPMLTWLTFPSMVLLFTSVAFLGARAWVGGEQEIHVCRSTTYFQDEGIALHNDAAGFFAAGTRYYELAYPGGGMLRPVTSSFDTPDRTLVDQDEGLSVQRIPTWSARAYTASYTRREEPEVTFEMDNAEPLVLTVHNKSKNPIRVIYFADRGRHWRIVPKDMDIVQPGKSASTPLRRKRSSGVRPANFPSVVSEIWNERDTRAPRFRSWDYRPLVRGGDTVLSYEVLDAAPGEIGIDGESSPAKTTKEVAHIVKRRAERPLNPEVVEESKEQ